MHAAFCSRCSLVASTPFLQRSEAAFPAPVSAVSADCLSVAPGESRGKPEKGGELAILQGLQLNH